MTNYQYTEEAVVGHQQLIDKFLIKNIQKFLTKHSFSLNVFCVPAEFYQKVSKEFTSCSLVKDSYCFETEGLLATISCEKYNPFVEREFFIGISLLGEVDKVRSFYEFLKLQERKMKNIAHINWYYESGPRLVSSKGFVVTADSQFVEEAYPFIPNVRKYFSDYMASTQSVLILLGAPGTGKTSFLRELITFTNTMAVVTYDSEVMRMDQFWLACIQETAVKAIILEDADTLMYDRTGTENKAMSRILNTANGIIPFGKKIILTANITHERIDPALTRPGRCFDVLNFRSLTRREAEVVGNKLGKTLLDKDEFTLSEICNGRSEERKRFGFV